MKPVPVPPPVTLSADELRILAAFRKMDMRRKRENLALLESDAVEHPHRTAPVLRLVPAAAPPAP